MLFSMGSVARRTMVLLGVAALSQRKVPWAVQGLSVGVKQRSLSGGDSTTSLGTSIGAGIDTLVEERRMRRV